jgi:hypothetical protein
MENSDKADSESHSNEAANEDQNNDESPPDESDHDNNMPEPSSLVPIVSTNGTANNQNIIQNFRLIPSLAGRSGNRSLPGAPHAFRAHILRHLDTRDLMRFMAVSKPIHEYILDGKFKSKEAAQGPGMLINTFKKYGKKGDASVLKMIRMMQFLSGKLGGYDRNFHTRNSERRNSESNQINSNRIDSNPPIAQGAGGLRKPSLTFANILQMMQLVGMKSTLKFQYYAET